MWKAEKARGGLGGRRGRILERKREGETKEERWQVSERGEKRGSKSERGLVG